LLPRLQELEGDANGAAGGAGSAAAHALTRFHGVFAPDSRLRAASHFRCFDSTSSSSTMPLASCWPAHRTRSCVSGRQLQAGPFERSIGNTH
jgi:hypothetical protein